MSTHPGMLLGYDDDGNVVATLSYMVLYSDDAERLPIGLIDFAGHEEAGGEHTAIWRAENVKGSKVWPEYLGGAAHDFRAELEGPAGAKRIAALVHKASGHRRERAVLEAEIGARIVAAKGQPADIRDLVGGPDRPLNLDAGGRNAPRVATTRPALPLVRAGHLPEG